MFSLYLLLFAIQQEIECHSQVCSPSPQTIDWFVVEISRLFRTQDKDLRQSALRYVTDNKDVLSDLYKAGGPMELIFEGPENIDIFLMKDSNYR